MLGDEMRTVDDAGVDVVAKLFAEGTFDNGECAAFVVRGEVFDVFQQEGAWSLFGDDAGDVENSVPCVSQAKPWALPRAFFFDTPAMENGWQGNPASSTSWSGMSVA